MKCCFRQIFKASNFIKKETLTQVFSCDFCKISKNAFSYRTPPMTASIDLTKWKLVEEVSWLICNMSRKCFNYCVCLTLVCQMQSLYVTETVDFFSIVISPQTFEKQHFQGLICTVWQTIWVILYSLCLAFTSAIVRDVMRGKIRVFHRSMWNLKRFK